jgi:hypothetical protein
VTENQGPPKSSATPSAIQAGWGTLHEHHESNSALAYQLRNFIGMVDEFHRAKPRFNTFRRRGLAQHQEPSIGIIGTKKGK